MSNFSLWGNDLFGEPIKPTAGGPLAQRFEWPPFSVLNARDGEWQERKRAWLAMGIESELGRGAIGDKETWLAQINKKIEPGGGGGPNSAYMRKEFKVKSDLSSLDWQNHGAQLPGSLWHGGSSESNQKVTAVSSSGTSIFDPVLAELCYRWFCPAGGQIVDPFAGGSVRGVVAGLLGYSYSGIDLRQEQIDANAVQREAICPGAPVFWHCGDSVERMAYMPECDFIFSCPPYGDLEQYSDDPKDLSNMEYADFIRQYRRIIERGSTLLRDNRLACFVVGDFRDRKTGMYRGFVADTIKAFQAVGLQLYNDAVLITAVGSLPIRVGAQFEGSRKLGKTHQNVLVFAKGNPKEAFNGK